MLTICILIKIDLLKLFDTGSIHELHIKSKFCLYKGDLKKKSYLEKLTIPMTKTNVKMLLFFLFMCKYFFYYAHKRLLFTTVFYLMKKLVVRLEKNQKNKKLNIHVVYVLNPSLSSVPE